MTLLNVQYDLKVKSIIKYKILSYNRDFRVNIIEEKQKVHRKYCQVF